MISRYQRQESIGPWQGNVEAWWPPPKVNANKEIKECSCREGRYLDTPNKTWSAKLSTTTAREQDRAPGPQVYGKDPQHPGKQEKNFQITSIVAVAGSAETWVPRWWYIVSRRVSAMKSGQLALASAGWQIWPSPTAGGWELGLFKGLLPRNNSLWRVGRT